MLRTLLALGCVRVIEHEQICQMLRIASHSYTCFVGCAKRSSVDSFFFFPFSYDLISSALKSSDGTLFSYDIKRLQWWVTLDHQEH